MAEETQVDTVESLKADAAFVERYLGGDREALARFTAAHERAATPPVSEAQGATGVLAGEPASAVPSEPSLDVPMLEPAASPAAYKLTPPEGQELPIELVRDVAETMHGAGVPKELGDGLWWRAVELHKAGQDVANQELRAAEGWASLTGSVGDAEAQQIVRDARAYIDQAAGRAPHVWDWVHESGLANDVWAVRTLANLYRAQSAPKRASGRA